MKRLVFQICFWTVFLMLSSIGLFGQYSDCKDMLEISGDIYHAKNITGRGENLEFSGNSLKDKRNFEKEENSIWYLITIPADGDFSFDIETKNPNNDWDFLLYKYDAHFCEQLSKKSVQPIRSNLSRSSKTGLSSSSTENFVGAGINNNYGKSIQVREGEKYVLVVNNPKRSGGNHTLVLHMPQKIKKELKEKPVEKVVETSVGIQFHLSIKDKKTKKLVKGSAVISGAKKEAIELVDVTQFKLDLLKKNYKLQIDAHAKGYMLSSTEIKVSKTKSVVNADVFVEHIEKGQKVNLKNIQFHGNRADFLPSAKGSLAALLGFMKVNEDVNIEVEGHVNGPGQKNSKAYQNLSYKRAEAIKNYLLERGINKDRIEIKGYGNSQMLFTNPKNKIQESANRRVEIKIT